MCILQLLKLPQHLQLLHPVPPGLSLLILYVPSHAHIVDILTNPLSSKLPSFLLIKFLELHPSLQLILSVIEFDSIKISLHVPCKAVEWIGYEWTSCESNLCVPFFTLKHFQNEQEIDSATFYSIKEEFVESVGRLLIHPITAAT